MAQSEHEGRLPDTMNLMAFINNRTETVTLRAEMHSLPEVLETVERFIRACGYCPPGVLDFVDEDTETSTTGRTQK